jgi:negative regulator of sigma E activity
VTGDRGGLHDRTSWASDHERARTRLAEQMDEPLWAEESAWLQEHLGGCAECQLVAEEYAAQREALRALRPPVPPRDLWARTSAALDMLEARNRPEPAPRFAEPREIDRSAPRQLRPRQQRPARRSWAPFGFVGAVAAVFVASFLIGSQVFHATPIGNQIAVIPSLVPTTAVAAATPGPTPIKVSDVGPVRWAESPDEESASTRIVTSPPVVSVCPAGSTDCAPIESSATVVTVPVAAKSIFSSPSARQVVVVGREKGTSSSSVFVANVDGSSVVTALPSPSESASSPPQTASPSESASPSASVQVSPNGSPVPPSATPAFAPDLLAIASDVVVMGQAAAYSPDGKWFAFTAQVAGGAVGPDIYRWRVGAPEAHAVTSDHRSVFSSWAGNLILGSRTGGELPSPPSAPSTEPSASPAESSAPSSPAETASPADESPAAESAAPSPSASADGSLMPRSFLIDPTTGASTDIAAAAWRPVVDPTGRFVVFWDGTVAAAASGGGWPTATGHLAIAAWDRMEAGATGADLQATALPSSLAIDGADWDAAWDETGEHLAVWIGDQANPGVGRVSFLTIDPAAGAVATSGPHLADALALRGIALSKGHLTWATPPTQGQPSRLKVYAWNGRDAGVRDSASNGETVVIVH